MRPRSNPSRDESQSSRNDPPPYADSETQNAGHKPEVSPGEPVRDRELGIPAQDLVERLRHAKAGRGDYVQQTRSGVDVWEVRSHGGLERILPSEAREKR